MKKFIDRILAATGNIAAMERLHIDDHTEAIINDFDMPPFAVSEENVLYAGFNELGGFYFLQTVIVGSFNLKTKKGIKISILGKDTQLELDSDMLELESDYSNVSKRFISKIDFQLEESDMAKISPGSIEKIILPTKKGAIEFKIYAPTEEEE